ncbi:Molybdopterin molybdenumtransferase [Paraliobacillus sp. PM-2]|uniref:molybdopterin molybdotransferase MoeA n=1 Tax=Paraliobacillus sp. PM-2 TaxID=1462524 RepID=UPI00061C9068|nr:gephyrin-like molybdotransferase Glp [Paraliobacillus sp. PM-2]CQR46564.1 Molybdopterin molybdenumtransferase [Paraliobacillus sp. PM-2]
MVERRKPIKVVEAINQVMQYQKMGSLEHISLESSLDRTLAEDIKADHDVPPFDRSPYDGYAIRSIDTLEASRQHPITLSVVGHIGAGEVFKDKVKENQVVRIMTGAPIPPGCDAVIMLELVEQLDTAAIKIKRQIKPNDNISFQGEDTAKDTVIVKKGTKINPGIVALLATFGYKKVPVVKKPTVGIIATGSELLEVDQPLEPGKIRNSNAYMIQAQLERVGAKAVYFGQFTDDLEVCYNQVKNALDQVDFFITTGGVSVGDFDYLPEIYRKLGAHVLFNKVGMRPGSVTTVAVLDGKLLFGLSGNPSACYVGFELFARPTIQSYLLNEKPYCKAIKAMMGTDFPKPNPFDRFVRGKLSYDKDKLVVSPVGLDKSNVVTSLGQANVLIVLPGGTRGYQKGSYVTALMLEQLEGDAVFLNNYQLKEKRHE